MSECKPNEHGLGQVRDRRDLQTGKLYRELVCADCAATLNSYEVLATTPAPMMAERLEELRIRVASEAPDFRLRVLSAFEMRELLNHIDSLTARIAEVIEERELYRRANVRLEAELAAARKPPDDGEVAAYVQKLRDFDVGEPDTWIADNWPREAADLLTRQAAALKEAERTIGRLEGRMCLICGAKEPCKETPEACTFDPSPIDAAKDFMARALAAEAKLETARLALEAVAPDEPMIQDEQGGCVWCGVGSGFDHEDNPDEHDDDCGWAIARKAIRALQQKDTAG